MVRNGKLLVRLSWSMFFPRRYRFRNQYPNHGRKAALFLFGHGFEPLQIFIGKQRRYRVVFPLVHAGRVEWFFRLSNKF